MTVCVCVCPAPAEACRGGCGPQGVSSWSEEGEESDHIAMSGPVVDGTGAAHHKLSGYHQQASNTGNTHECEYLKTLCGYILYTNTIYYTQTSKTNPLKY